MVNWRKIKTSQDCSHPHAKGMLEGFTVLCLLGCQPKNHGPIKTFDSNHRLSTTQQQLRPKKQILRSCRKRMEYFRGRYFEIISRNDIFLCICPSDSSKEVQKDQREFEDLSKEIQDLVSSTHPYLLRCNRILDEENPGMTTFDMNDFAWKQRKAMTQVKEEVYETLKTLWIKGQISDEEWKAIVQFRINWMHKEDAYREVFRTKLEGSISGLLMENYNIITVYTEIHLLLYYLETLQNWESIHLAPCKWQSANEQK